MKRTGWIVVVLLSSAALLYADSGEKKEMSGWLCNSKCVAHTDNQVTCDKNCTETGGDVVFIDNDGKVSKIRNQEKVKEAAGKKVRMEATMDEETDMLDVFSHGQEPL